MLYVIMYLVAIVLANLSVAFVLSDPSTAGYFRYAIIVNAFLFIGLDLTARDRLHDAWRGNNLVPKMAALIAAGSVLSWLLNRNAGQVALASFAAFATAATVDAVVYHGLGNYPRWLRINGSNVPSALVDSLVFPTLAVGILDPVAILGQFLAKTLGGFIWSLVFRWMDRRTVAAEGSG